MTKHIEPFIIVVDNRHSALALVAKQRSKILPSEVCYASDFRSPTSLLNYLQASDKKKILFAWRGALRESLLDPNSIRKYKKLIVSKTVHMLVPDLLGTKPEYSISETLMVNVTHGYWVTSQELKAVYTRLYPLRVPSGVLHDIPDISSILKIREMKLNRSGIVWVGNSQWGSNHGYVDHKGYAEVVQRLSRSDLPFNPFKIRDSSINRIPNGKVLLEIAESEILIQASAHEGTGLPLLEALGVGTIPITTDVGIAREVLTGQLEQLIVERSASSFERKIRELGESVSDLSQLCITTFDLFMEKIEVEAIDWHVREVTFDNLDRESFASFRIKLIWLYRFYRAKLI
jgi:hypothetical protein